MMDRGYAAAEDSMDIPMLISKLAARGWWLVFSVFFFAALFAFAAYALTPIYRSSVVLIPAKANKDAGLGGGALGGSLGGVASLVGIDLGGADSVTEEAIAVLKSREFIAKFIAERNLMPVLYAKLWDTQSGKWKVDEKHQPTPGRAFKYFDKRIRSITQEKKSSLITLNIDWTDRVQAAEWANDLVARLNLEMRQREIARADSAVGYLEKAFESTNVIATREAIGRLIESSVKQRMLANVTPDFAFRIIDPAATSDRDDRYSPNRFMLILLGPIVGFIFGVFGILAFDALRSARLPTAEPD